MRRAISVLPREAPSAGPVIDTLLLDYDQRQHPTGTHVALRGTGIVIDLAEPVQLRTDDRLALDDGSLVEVVARPEPLLEVRGRDAPDLARIAWMLGDRHVPVEIAERRLRLRPAPGIETLLQAAGVRIAQIEAPFDPEGGAYTHGVAAATGV